MVENDSKSRLDSLKRLLGERQLSTQDQLREKLQKLGFDVTQSTVSRDLRKLGAVKAVNHEGETVYRLSTDIQPPIPGGSLRDLVTQIRTNGSIVVVQTTPGSASLVARQLDLVKPAGILGTIAGDDTIFVAPASLKDIRVTIREIEKSLE